MKLAASVSLAALALAACASTPPAEMAAAAPSLAVQSDTPGTTDAPPAPQYPLTPEGARAFVTAVEKDLFDLSVIGSRAAWVNATLPI